MRIARGNTLLSHTDDRLNNSENNTDSANIPPDTAPLDTSILLYGPGDAILFQDISYSSEGSDRDPVGKVGSNGKSEQKHDKEYPLQDYVPCGIEGHWVGTFANDLMPPFECIVQPIIGEKLAANGRDFADPIEISGLFHEQTTDVSLTLSCSGYFPVRLKGAYNRPRDTIHGWWEVVMERTGGIGEGDDPPQTPDRTFSMTRHSIASFRFKKLLTPRECASGLSIAQRRWAFAIQSVLYGVQDRMGSWDFMRRRIAERNEWNEHGTRYVVLPQVFPVTRGFITAEETNHWYEVRNKLHPRIAALYHWVNRNSDDRWWWDW